MIHSLEIRNFKSLANCSIGQFSRVNLIVGKNNVGKSSLLEALSLLLADGSPRHVQKLLKDRGLTLDFRTAVGHGRTDLAQKALATLFTGRDVAAFNRTRLSVAADAGNGKRLSVDMRLGFVIRSMAHEGVFELQPTEKSDVELADGIEMYSGLYVTNSEGERFFRITDRGLHVPLYATTENHSGFQFVRPQSVSAVDNSQLFDAIAMTGLQRNLVEALNIIDPRIRDVNFLNDPLAVQNERVPIVVLHDDDTRYPLRSMGDGVNRILAIVLSMLNCKGGTLLVDEFENGLHYTALCRLWEMVFQIAEALDVQVFVTTHSNDCINSFIKSDKRREGALIRLESRKEGVIGVPYTDSDELDYIRYNNVEVR